jgi:outer membrane scaffolding protein for murein synthesis (MipA/OmpV family)
MMRYAAATIAALLMVNAPGVHAQSTGDQTMDEDIGPPPPNPSGLSLTAGPGLAVAPKYPGADTYRVLPLPSIDLRYGRFFFNRDGLGVSLINEPPGGWQVGVAAFVDFDRRERDDPVRLRGLGNIDTALQGRFFVAKGLGPVMARATLAHDFGGTNGTTLDLSAGFRTNLTDRAMLFAGPTLSLADDKYMQGFFGITDAQAQRGSRSAYDASAGLYKVSLNAGVNFALSPKWSAGAFASFGYLVGDAGRSPVVAQREQPGGGIVLSHRF